MWTYADVCGRMLVRQQQRVLVGGRGCELVFGVMHALLNEGASPDIITYNTLLHSLLLPQVFIC